MLKKVIKYCAYKNEISMCFTDKVLKNQQGNVDPRETFNQRISRTINNTEPGGSTVVFGILGESPYVNSLGKIEGQIGGISKVLRNKF